MKAATWTALTMAAAMAAAGQAATVWDSINPYLSPVNPREDLATTVGAYGVWPDSCVPVDSQVGLYAGNVIYVDFYDDPFAYPYCYGEQTDFGSQGSTLLPAGRYNLYASLFTNTAWFPFDPPDWQETHTQFLRSFNVYYLGDLDLNGTVDVLDLLDFIASFGKSKGEAGYNPACDLTGDNTVDVIDLLTLIDNFGKSI